MENHQINPSQMRSSGGAANINGILYQLLWCVLRTLEITHLESPVIENSNKLVKCRLILEPHGGDVQELAKNKRRVIQLKSCSPQKTWSLRDIIVDILPDLYRAIDLSKENSTYEFVNEGKMGRWSNVYQFFKRLRKQPCLSDNIITFSRGKQTEDGFWNLDTYSEIELINHVVAYLRTTTAVNPDEPEVITKQKVIHLLARFRFQGSITHSDIVNDLHSLLMPIIDFKENIDTTIKSLLGSLLQSASRGNSIINPDELMKTHRLNGVSLKNWSHIKEKSSQNLIQWLDLQQYNRAIDVRTHVAEEYLEKWPQDIPILALTGESGCGKSWLQYASALHASFGSTVICCLKASGNLKEDLEIIADKFWLDVADRDQSLPLSRIVKRLNEILPEQSNTWLTVFIDNVTDLHEAESLARLQLKDWGIRLCVSGSQTAINTMKAAAGSRIKVFRIGDFTNTECNQYLENHFGEEWFQIAPDVRETLRRPLLAKLFCTEIATPNQWHPTNEYELYNRFWNRLNEGEHELHPNDSVLLAKLAATLITKSHYPWDISQLNSLKISDDTICRLEKAGWLKRTSSGNFEITHDRLANFAIAKEISSSIYTQNRSLNEISNILQDIFRNQLTHPNIEIGYVVLDSLFLILESNDGLSIVTQLLTMWDGIEFTLRETLYRDLLPTLGNSIAPAIYLYLKSISHTHQSHWQPTVDCLNQLDDEQIIPIAQKMLTEGNPFDQHIACKLLSQHPTTSVLDQLFQLHCSMKSEPETYSKRPNPHWFLYKDSFSAISSCIRLNPGWLVQKINSSTPNTECLNDLVYILSNLGKKELWEKCKEKIILNIPESDSRCIAANIEQYRDASEIDKLLGWLPEEHDSLGSASLRALVFIRPDLAIENLERLPDSSMYLSRYWYLPLLLEINGEETRGKLLEIIKAKPLDDILFNVYQGNENFMDIATFRFFLRRLTEILRCVLCQGDFNRKILFFLLMLISSCHRLDMLQELGKWRDELGPLLEELITSIGPRKGIYETNHESRYAIAILRRIGGNHWHQIVHMYLASDNHHAHLEGMEWALRIDDSISLDDVLKISRLEAQSKEEDYEILKSINVLAAKNNINHLVDRLLNIGLHTLNSLWKHTSCLNPFSDESMQQAFRILNTREPKSQLTGSILAIGAGKRFDYSSAVCAILKNEEPGSDIALACILTIQNLKTPINEAVSLLKKHLKNENHRHNVIFALLTISTNEALDLLLDELANRFDPALASDLCNHKSSSMRSIELTKNYLSKIDSHSRTHLLSEITNNFDDVFLPQVLIDDDIREHISTISLSSHVDPWVIRGLASFNPSLAYIAAKKALLNTDLLNRDRYVPQIVKLDPVKALDDLLRHAPSEPSTWVLYSIGRCLSSITNSDCMFMLLESSDEFVRESACRMLSMWPVENFPVDQLKNMLTDPARRVSLAAIDGLQNYRRMIYTNELVEALESEKDRVKKWRLLECIAEIADPGDFNNTWLDWRIRVVNVADYAMASFLNEKLKHRRDDLKKKLDKADSDSGGRRKYASRRI